MGMSEAEMARAIVHRLWEQYAVIVDAKKAGEIAEAIRRRYRRPVNVLTMPDAEFRAAVRPYLKKRGG